MAGAAMAAALPQSRSCAPGLLRSSSVWASSQPVLLCAHHAWVSPCATHRLLGRSCPPVPRVAFPAVAALADEHEDDDDGGLSLYAEELGLEADVTEQVESVPSTGATVKRTFRLLGNKETKELRAYAHQLGNDICIHQGNGALTANCVTAISDALEANELVKIRVLDNLDEELGDTASQLEAKTGAQIVGKMGRTLLLYRPSMRKLKAAPAAEEKAYKYQKRKNILASRTKSSR